MSIQPRMCKNSYKCKTKSRKKIFLHQNTYGFNHQMGPNHGLNFFNENRPQIKIYDRSIAHSFDKYLWSYFYIFFETRH